MVQMGPRKMLTSMRHGLAEGRCYVVVGSIGSHPTLVRFELVGSAEASAAPDDGDDEDDEVCCP